MKNKVKRTFVLLLVMTIASSLLYLPVAARTPEPANIEASYSRGVVDVSGTVPHEVLAVAVLIYSDDDTDDDTLLRMETTGVSEGNFSAKIKVKLPSGTYTVKVADYEGGDFFTDAEFTVKAASPPSFGGGTTRGSSESSEYYADNSGGDSLPVNVDSSGGNASVDLGVLAEGLTGGEHPVIALPSIPGVGSYTASLPASSLSGAMTGSVTVNSDVGNFTIPGNMLSETILTGSAEITIGTGDKSVLSDDVRAAVGDRPLISLTLSIDGRQTAWSNPRAPIIVSIPYVPTAAEFSNPESIVIWYVDGKGNIAAIPNGYYDVATGTVTFSTTHFSDFAVVYNKVDFDDVAVGAWYNKAVSFIAARNITSGTGDGKFSPETLLTRGQFIVMLMRAYGIEPDEGSGDNFADAGSTYYTDYLAAAKRRGISTGIGNNLFAPDKDITRQEMFTLLYNVLAVIGKLPEGNAGKKLSDYSDASSIASWAKDAMTFLVETGKVSGSDGKLSPTGSTTRAEMAQVLYNLLFK